jgi:hypothetical protein
MNNKMYFLVEWINGTPKRIAQHKTLKGLCSLSKEIKANKEGIYEGTFPNGNYWKIITEEIFVYGSDINV